MTTFLSEVLAAPVEAKYYARIFLQHYLIQRADICGICEESPGEIIWCSPNSFFAHLKCILAIRKANEHLEPWINSHPNPSSAHAKLIKAVRIACKEPLLGYCEKNGTDALKQIFNKAAVKALIPREFRSLRSKL